MQFIELVDAKDQKLVYEQVLELAARAAEGQKQVLIVSGGPGTGKFQPASGQ